MKKYITFILLTFSFLTSAEINCTDQLKAELYTYLKYGNSYVFGYIDDGYGYTDFISGYDEFETEEEKERREDLEIKKEIEELLQNKEYRVHSKCNNLCVITSHRDSFYLLGGRSTFLAESTVSDKNKLEASQDSYSAGLYRTLYFNLDMNTGEAELQTSTKELYSDIEEFLPVEKLVCEVLSN